MRIIEGDYDPRRLPIDDAAQVAAYLASGHGVICAPTSKPDEIDPTHTILGIGYVTDGMVIWSAAAFHYTREHGIAPPADLLAHIRAQHHRFPTVVSRDFIDAARQHLLSV